MKSLTNNPASKRLHARGAAVCAAALLLLAPSARAQDAEPAGEQAPTRVPAERDKAAAPAAESGPQLYNIKYEGGLTSELQDWLRASFPEDNVVMGTLKVTTRLPAFELRSVRAEEVARTIEFLSEGFLSVEVVQNAGPRTLWLVGRKEIAEGAAAAKMRSVAAPHLFADQASLGEVLEAVEGLERERLREAELTTDGRAHRKAVVTPLRSQSILSITGDEDGVAGVESLIKAAEQRLSNEIAAKVAAYTADAPKIRAVLAPHVFADEGRRKQVIAGLREVETTLHKIHLLSQKATGSETVPLPWADSTPHPEQKIFLLAGTEAGVTGMESIIRAAEQLAAEEDALRRADRAEAEARKAEAIRAEEKAALKVEEPRAKPESREE